jgi:tetratricopeptide (TPR) repeat protein
MQQSFLCPRCNNVAFLGQRFCGFCDLIFLYSCNQCGSALEPGTIYCGNCGTEVDWAVPAPQYSSQPAATVGQPVNIEQPVHIGQPGMTPAREPLKTPTLADSQSRPESYTVPAAPPVPAPPLPTQVPPEHKAKAEAHQERSFELLKDGHYSLAIDELTKAIQFDPTTAIVYLLRGGAFYKKGDLDLALSDLNRAIELDPNLAAAFYNRGSAFYYKKEFDRAINDFSRSIAIDDTEPGAFHNRGCAYMMKGQYYQAIEDISRSIMLDSRDPRVYCSRGSAYAQTGQLLKAAEDFRKAKGMATDPAVIQKADQALKELGQGL